jgi:hypothetical protein
MDLYERANSIIGLRTRLGHRTEIASSRGYRLIWSNAYQRWNMFYYGDKKGASLLMDANVVFIPLEKGEKKSDLTAIVGDLRGLPLYGNSFEARFLR